MPGSATTLRIVALAACALIAAVVFAVPVPDRSLRSAIALHDFGHVPAFGLVARCCGLPFTWPTGAASASVCGQRPPLLSRH